MTGSGNEKRRHPRHKVLKSAKVIFHGGSSLYDCHVRDWSESGARLVFPELTPLPGHFRLVMHDGTSRECMVVRTDGVAVSVEFFAENSGGAAGRTESD
jgi:hypothetical protein